MRSITLCKEDRPCQIIMSQAIARGPPPECSQLALKSTENRLQCRRVCVCVCACVRACVRVCLCVGENPVILPNGPDGNMTGTGAAYV